MPDQPGQLVLFGSGETAAIGRKVFDEVLKPLPSPVSVAILETPSGFQPNTARVAGKIADFMRQSLQNYELEISVIPARQRGTLFSPDDPSLAEAVLAADCIVLGPGSPTYAVRQLRGSQVWGAVRLRYSTGATLVLASASVLAVSVCTLPVYEIYKAGSNLYWEPGLDLLGPVGLSLAFVPHWNNREGGEDLDTSRGFMGEERFGRLRALLPEPTTVIGIDEHTALIVEPDRSTGRVVGRGGIALERGAQSQRFEHGDELDLHILGDCDWPAMSGEVPGELRRRMDELIRFRQLDSPSRESVPPEVQALVERREEARARRDWKTADLIRDELTEQGYALQDTPTGPEVRSKS